MGLSRVALARSTGTAAAVVTRIRGISPYFFPVDMGRVDVHVYATCWAVRVLVAHSTKLLGRDALPCKAHTLLQCFALDDGQAPEETSCVKFDAFLAHLCREDRDRDATAHRAYNA